MGQYHLSRVLKPKSIAIIDSDDSPEVIGHGVFTHLTNAGFAGSLYPILPNHSDLPGKKVFKSLHDLEEVVDLAIITAPIHSVPDIIDTCIERKAGGAIILSDRKHVNDKIYKQIEQNISQKAYAGGLRIMGPNCLGVIQPGLSLNASLVPVMPNKGHLSFVSQSRAISAAVIDLALQEQFGFSHFIDIGAALDIDLGDMIDYLGGDYSTKSILIYMDQLTHVRKFMSAARAVSRIKPIIVLKAGKSREDGPRASYPNRYAIDEEMIYDALFKRAGIIRVDTIEALFDCAELAAKKRRFHTLGLHGSGLAIITNGKGPGRMAVNSLQQYGKSPVRLKPDTLTGLEEKCMSPCGMKTPITVAWNVSPQKLEQVLKVVLKADEVDAVVVTMAPFAAVDPRIYAEKIITIAAEQKKPIFTSWMGGKGVTTAVELLNQAGIPTYETPERAVRAFLYMTAYARNLEALRQVPSKLSKDVFINFDRAGKVISKALVNVWMSKSESMEILAAYGFPTESTITPKDSQSKQSIPDYELVLGATRDDNFGPIIHLGIGGIIAKSINAISVCFPPMNRLLARRLMQAANVTAVLKGDNEHQPADFEQFEELVVRLSQLLIDFPDIADLVIDPICIKNGQAVVGDARIRILPNGKPSPQHLVISPYPAEYEAYKSVKDNLRIFVRPVRPEDAPLFRELFENLSPTSIYYRFFSPMKRLSPTMLARFTQIDYDRDIAQVALGTDTDNREKMLGVARIIGDADNTTGEFAVLVGDPWHGKGIGAFLLQNCLDIANSRGFKTVMGFVLRENKGMLALGKKLGFSVKKSSDGDEYELVIRW